MQLFKTQQEFKESGEKRFPKKSKDERHALARITLGGPKGSQPVPCNEGFETDREVAEFCSAASQDTYSRLCDSDRRYAHGY